MTKTITVTPEDVKPGQVYTFEKEGGDRYANRPVFSGSDKVLYFNNGAQLLRPALLVGDGFTITQEVEEPVLPTEPGWYQSVDHLEYDGYVLNESGGWRQVGSGYKQTTYHMLEVGRLVRLVPEGSEREAAIREVIDHLASLPRDTASNTSWADALCIYFGMTP